MARFHRNPLFRGIRYGNLWDRDYERESLRPQFLADLKYLAEAGLSLDTANPTAALMAWVVRITDRVPGLRVIVDHLPQIDPPADPAVMRALAERPQVYVKVSQVLRRVNGRVPDDLAFYRSRLDEIFGLFGEDRLLYGSDWPNKAISGATTPPSFAWCTNISAPGDRPRWKSTSGKTRWPPIAGKCQDSGYASRVHHFPP